MLGLPPDSDLAVDDRNRRRFVIKFATDTVWDAQYRHDRAFSERHRRMQSFEAGRDPTALGRQKPQALARRHVVREDQLNPAFGGIDPQPDPPRPRANPDRQWGTQI